MMLSGSGPAASWRAFVAVGLASLLCVVSGVQTRAQNPPPPPPTQTPPPAQTPPAQPPAQQTPPPAKEDPLKLKGDVPVLIVNQIVAEKSAEFEAAWAAIKEKLAKAEKPELKAFGETLNKMYKVGIPPEQAAGTVLYVFQIDQPSSTQSYHPVELVFNSGLFERADADIVWAKLKEAYKNITAWPLAKIGS